MTATSITAYQMGVSVVHDDATGPLVEVDGTAGEGGPLTAKGARVMARALLAAADEVDGASRARWQSWSI